MEGHSDPDVPVTMDQDIPVAEGFGARNLTDVQHPNHGLFDFLNFWYQTKRKFVSGDELFFTGLYIQIETKNSPEDT